MHTNTGQYLQIHTYSDTYRWIPTNTYNMYYYIQIHANTDQYIPYIPIHTINLIQVNTDKYIQIQCNTYEYVQYIPFFLQIPILINTYQYLHKWPINTYQYIPILAIHSKGNTCQYIPEYIPCQFIPIHHTTVQGTYHQYKEQNPKLTNTHAWLHWCWMDQYIPSLYFCHTNMYDLNTGYPCVTFFLQMPCPTQS